MIINCRGVHQNPEGVRGIWCGGLEDFIDYYFGVAELGL